MRIALLVLLVFIAGCVQMTEVQKKQVRQKLWIGLGAGAVGYALNDDDDTFVTNEFHEHNEIIKPGDGCHPEPRCR